MAPDAASGLDAGLHVVTPPEQPAWPSGQYAGPATRLAAYAVDVAVSTVLLGVLTVGAIVAFDLVTGARLFLYYFVSWATVGKTPGMALLGLRVTRRDGEAVRTGQAAVRTLAFPLSFIGGLGFVGIVIGREHRALHDVVAGTTVLYD